MRARPLACDCARTAARRSVDHGGADRRTRHDPRDQRDVSRHGGPAPQRQPVRARYRLTKSRSAPKRGPRTSCARTRRNRRPIISARPGPSHCRRCRSAKASVSSKAGSRTCRAVSTSTTSCSADGTHEPVGRQATRAHSASMVEIEPSWATAIADWVDCRRATRFSRRRGGQRLHGHGSAAPRREHAGDSRERTDGVAGIRRRTLSQAAAFRHRAARRAETQCVHGAGCRHRFAVRSAAPFQRESRGPCDTSQGGVLPNTRRLARHSRPGRLRSGKGHSCGIEFTTSAQPCGSLLALPSSPCTVCSRAGATVP